MGFSVGYMFLIMLAQDSKPSGPGFAEPYWLTSCPARAERTEMFEVLEFVEALDKYKEANEAHDNNPGGHVIGDTWDARQIALNNLEDAFRNAIKAVLFNE